MAASLTSARMSYFNLVLFTFGFAYYVLLAVAGIVLTWYRRGYAARTMLMGYSICLLLVNMAYGILRLVVQERQLVERVKATESCSPFTVALQALAVLNILCNDTLFIHRAFILMQRRVTVLLFPAVLYTILFGTGVLISLSCASSPTQLPFNINYDALFATFLTASCVLNATLTVIIARRLLLQPSSEFDCSRAGRIVIVVVESALLWTVAGLTYLVFIIARSEMSDAVSALFDLAGEISPAMLIFRLAWHARDSEHSELRGSLEKKGSEITLSESGSNGV